MFKIFSIFFAIISICALSFPLVVSYLSDASVQWYYQIEGQLPENINPEIMCWFGVISNILLIIFIVRDNTNQRKEDGFKIDHWEGDNE